MIYNISPFQEKLRASEDDARVALERMRLSANLIRQLANTPKTAAGRLKAEAIHGDAFNAMTVALNRISEFLEEQKEENHLC